MRSAPFSRVVATALGAALAVSAAMPLLPTGPAGATVVNLINTAAAVLAAWGCLRRSRDERDARRGWRLLATAGAFQAGYQLWPVMHVATTGRLAPFPGPADWLGLAVLPLAAAGMLTWPIARGTATARARTALDGALFGLAVFFVVWALGLGDALAASDMAPAARVLSIGGFAIIVATLGVVVYLVAEAPARLLGPLGWLGASLLLGTMSYVAQLILGLRGLYYVGHPSDVVVVFSLTAFALAPWSPVPVRESPWRGGAPRGPRFGTVMVYLPVFTALAAGTWRIGQTHAGDPLLGWLGISLGAGVLARQLLALRDVARLSRSLESQVHERTLALAHSQEALARSRRLEAIGQMAGGIAHDFNNLTQVISGWAGELRRALPADHPDQEAVTEIERASARAADLTRQLLTFARRQPIAPRIIHLAALIQDVEPLLKRLVTASVQMELRVDPGAGPVFADPTQVEQLLSNLAVNARDAMPEGGTLRIDVGNVTIEEGGGGEPALAPGRYVRIIVEDSGHGMSEETMGRIFEPFFTTKPAGKGTGLGLSTCYGIVSKAGGRIRAESTPGRGTRFLVDLPMADVPRA